MVVPVSRTSRRRVGAAVAALSAALLLAACSNTTGGGGNTGFVATQDTGMTVVAASARVAAPNLAGTTLDGKKLALSDYRGDYVVVNVWGSWCGPCRVEGPALEETYQKYQAKGVKFLGINTREQSNAAALAYVASAGITYPSLQDPDETLVLEFKSILPPTGIPSSVIIDPNGKVAARIVGGVTEPQLIQALDQLMGAS